MSFECLAFCFLSLSEWSSGTGSNWRVVMELTKVFHVSFTLTDMTKSTVFRLTSTLASSRSVTSFISGRGSRSGGYLKSTGRSSCFFFDIYYSCYWQPHQRLVDGAFARWRSTADMTSTTPSEGISSRQMIAIFATPWISWGGIFRESKPNQASPKHACTRY